MQNEMSLTEWLHRIGVIMIILHSLLSVLKNIYGHDEK